MNPIEHKELVERLLDPDLLLLDVLPRRVYERGHLPNARCLPLGEIESRAPSMIEAGDEVVVYCVNEH